jgi:2-methylisocitrate lyase-like PEP mutase family enzyme
MRRHRIAISQSKRGETFRKLHERAEAFVIPNPWDGGSARLLAGLGFPALATTSAGLAFSLGRSDYGVGREEVMAHVRSLVSSTDLPVSVDLENGFTEDSAGVAETIRLAAAAGAVGGSIEDTTRAPEDPIFDLDRAVERVRAASEAAKSLAFPFTLTARAENYLWGRPDLADTIRRLRAFQEAGADVLYAPGIVKQEEIEELVRSVDRPVNVLAGMRGFPWSVTDLSRMGVKRISVGGALTRSALGGLLRAAREMLDQGTFGFATGAPSSEDVARIAGLE